MMRSYYAEREVHGMTIKLADPVVPMLLIYKQR